MFQTDKIMFYHIPRTGSMYVKEVMRRSGVPYTRSTRKRIVQPFHLIREHETPAGILESEKKGKLSFCFVRQPVAWLRSFWAYRTKTGDRGVKFPLDRIWDDNFNKFCENVLAKYPNGFVTKLFQYYVHDVDVVGRQENLTEDLIKILNKAGQIFDEAKLRTFGRYNRAAVIDRYAKLCSVNPELKARINKADKWVLDNYYNDYD